MLTLADMLMLTAIDPEKDRVYVRSSSALPYGLSGALIAELMLSANVELQKDKVVVIHREHEDPVLQKTLQIIENDKRKRSAKDWVYKLTTAHKNLPNVMAYHLEEQSYLDVKEHKFLWIFPHYTYHLREENNITGLRETFNTVLQKAQEKTPFNREEERLIVLLSLIDASKLLGIVYPDSKEERSVRKHLKQVNKDLPVSKAVYETIMAIEASVVIAVTAASTAANSSNSSN
ncbi:hypothetical protein JCM19037_1851 [Geomicrobium sp. JCM 19037]|uniref:GOLPH3/VPS74 family protein n=1 Tax=Geomicrobium sp. JCM 19037 TaxID=1460634 RepID=UPI00045F4A70|nr:GPP34 family phosphoprotein [Geomicrobium sp. JCM 19037]GAK03517.1 hypothetical protein JCM19037_1851 [Geomicrobium sp. JCM 19037]